MTTTPAQDKAKQENKAAVRQICSSCRHPRPFHPTGQKCRAFGCSCVDFRSTVETTTAVVSSEPRNIKEGLLAVPGLESDLRDRSMGHKALARLYPFTSETSIRRWRAANGVVVSS